MQYKKPRKPGDLYKRAKGKKKKSLTSGSLAFEMESPARSSQSLLARNIGKSPMAMARGARQVLKKKKSKHSKKHKKGAMCKGC